MFYLSRGKIKYYTIPPEDTTDAHISSEIIQQIAAEFDIASYEAMETEVLGALESSHKPSIVNFPINSDGPVNASELFDKMDVDGKGDMVSIFIPSLKMQ